MRCLGRQPDGSIIPTPSLHYWKAVSGLSLSKKGDRVAAVVYWLGCLSFFSPAACMSQNPQRERERNNPLINRSESYYVRLWPPIVPVSWIKCGGCYKDSTLGRHLMKLGRHQSVQTGVWNSSVFYLLINAEYLHIKFPWELLNLRCLGCTLDQPRQNQESGFRVSVQL